MHLPMLISDLTYILGVAAVITLVFRKIRQPVVLGYIIAGMIVGPYLPGPNVAETKDIQVWAELGVIFLMFALGLEFSFRRLLTVGAPAAVTGVMQISVMLVLGYAAALSLGWDHKTGLFLGGMLAISSTTIIIKVFDELKLRGRRFTDLVFGILIIEDLVAILILVALASFGVQTEMDGWGLITSAGKLIMVVGTWFIFGMFIVPRYMRSVGKHGSNELLILSSVALCLGLVTLAARFEYSVALGAFMMGSILAETREVKRIEHLVEPLKDIFGAVFFVSVGMLLDFKVVAEHWEAIGLICLVVLIGKILSGFAGAIVAGQPIEDATRVTLSKAQIGEFSFIIANLGLSLRIIPAELYSIIVAVSLITTFLTPYLIRWSDPVATKLTETLPSSWKAIYARYSAQLERWMARPNSSKEGLYEFGRWIACAVIVVAIFGTSGSVLPKLLTHVNYAHTGYIAWTITFIVSIPFIWAMIFYQRPNKLPEQRRPGRRLSLMGAVFTILLVGLLSQEFLTFFQSLSLTCIGILVVLFFLRRRVESRYRWFERHFLEGFSGNEGDQKRTQKLSKILAPWNVTLQEIEVPVGSSLGAKTLEQLQLRERYGINVVCIERGEEIIVTPFPSERLLPMDVLLVFGDDADVAKFRQLEVVPKHLSVTQKDGDIISLYRTTVVPLKHGHGLVGKSIRESRLREDHGCLVVGIERHQERLKNPSSDLKLDVGDVLWIVGPSQKLNALAEL